MTEQLNILSDNLGVGTILSETSAANVALIQGNERWGQDMFGSETILGAAYSNSYVLGVRMIMEDDFSLNIVRSA